MMEISVITLWLKSFLQAFFYKQHFISNAKMKLAKNQANAKQHPEAELLVFGNYSHSSPGLSSKNNRTYSKNKRKNKCVCIHEIIRLIIIKIKMKMENRSCRYDINRPRSRHGHKYSNKEVSQHDDAYMC